MSLRVSLPLILIAAALIGIGCSNTAEGVQKDATADQKMAAEEGSKAMDSASQTGKDAGAALSLTPAVKMAITNESSLNSSDNHIDVDSDAKEVRLNGTVATEEAKQKAEAIAKKTLEDKKATQTLVNNLKVTPKTP